MDRRKFLKASGLVAAPFLLPSVLRGPVELWARCGDPGPAPAGHWNRTLVLIELAGGNDGLNTVIPFGDDEYARQRPNLAISKDVALKVADGLGFHPSLAPLHELFEQRELAVLQGVGYAKPNRSHFRSIEIWETGSASDQFLDRGWLADLFGRVNRPATLAADGIVIGKSDLGPLAGGELRNLTMENVPAFLAQARRLKKSGARSDNPALAHLVRVQEQIVTAARIIQDHVDAANKPAMNFQRNLFGRQLMVAAELITAGVPALVVKLSLGGFDTHNNQQGNHRRLLGELATGLAEFRRVLKGAGRWQDTLVMTYSEFGRRVKENGNRGTDHGTAAPHFLLGGRVEGGIFGDHPSLTDLDGGDLRHSLHFRRLYQTAAHGWWGLPKTWIGEQFKPIGCLKTSQGASG